MILRLYGFTVRKCIFHSNNSPAAIMAKKAAIRLTIFNGKSMKRGNWTKINVIPRRIQLLFKAMQQGFPKYISNLPSSAYNHSPNNRPGFLFMPPSAHQHSPHPVAPQSTIFETRFVSMGLPYSVLAVVLCAYFEKLISLFWLGRAFWVFG